MNTGGTTAEIYRPVHPVRLVTAASLFDGHDAAINVMRRILQAQGAEVIHLGHNRSVDEIVRAAVEEDVQGVAVSSYQGGHIEYFRYLVDRLRAEGRPDAKVFGGGGGVIVPDEIAELHDYGVTHVFSPEDGQRLGLARMVNTIVEACDIDLASQLPAEAVEKLVEGATVGPWPGPSPPFRAARSAVTSSSTCGAPRPGVPCRFSASPARADPASRRSPTSWCGASGSTTRTSCASRWSPSTRRGAGPGARCSATGSA